MSIKSLLQTILLLLIFITISGIYYLYFYSGPLDNKESDIKNLDKFTKEKSISEETEGVDIFESITEDKNEEIEQINSIKESNSDIEQINNLTKEIEYITSNKNGDIFKIIAKFGKTNIKNSNILDLKIVNAEVQSSKRSSIFLYSDLANYNYTNQNSKFYNNVKIEYDEKVITCDKLDLIISENIAVAYNNVIVKDNTSVMKAQMITLDIITKDININSKDKINIITQNN